MKVLTLVLALWCGAAFASDTMAPIMVHDAKIAASVGAAKTGAGYFTLMNHGGVDDVLLSIEADFPRIEIHNTVADGDNASVMTMVRQDAGVALPAGGMVAFSPGGYHVMFMGLATPFEAGTKVEAQFVFEALGQITVIFDVVDRTEIGEGAHDHGSN